jgi:hypothetical protein
MDEREGERERERGRERGRVWYVGKGAGGKDHALDAWLSESVVIL